MSPGGELCAAHSMHPILYLLHWSVVAIWLFLRSNTRLVWNIDRASNMSILHHAFVMTFAKAFHQKCSSYFLALKIHLFINSKYRLCKPILQQTQSSMGWTWNIRTNAHLHLWLGEDIDGVHSSQYSYAVPDGSQRYVWCCSCPDIIVWAASPIESRPIFSTARRKKAATPFHTQTRRNGHQGTRLSWSTQLQEGPLILLSL